MDGVTATAILLTYLRKQGAQVGFYIPDRHGEGYGLNIAAIEQIATHSKLLITVDCGITCAAEVARAKELGMRVIVTDHHQLGPQIPNAKPYSIRCWAIIRSAGCAA
ncbi:MAG: DHH family phosphoesterase [Christensenellales bacterium]